MNKRPHVKMTTNESGHAIIAFNDLEGPHGKLAADAVLRGLFANNAWYTTRSSRIIAPGTKILFYKSRSGFCASAIVVSIALDKTTRILGEQVFGAFACRLELDGCRIFAAPVDVRTIVDALDFVTNKKYWGQAFRTTPRQISERDFTLITRKAETAKNA